MNCPPSVSRKLAITLLASIATFGITTGGLSAQEHSRTATATQPPINDGLPMPGFEIDPSTTAIVITDPQNDFLSPEGVTWGVVGQSITANRTVEKSGRTVRRG